VLPVVALTDDAAVVVEPQVEAKLAATASQSLRLLLMAFERSTILSRARPRPHMLAKDAIRLFALYRNVAIAAVRTECHTDFTCIVPRILRNSILMLGITAFKVLPP
jgi:hypothetical protein